MNILLDSFHPAEPYYYMCNPIPKKSSPPPRNHSLVSDPPKMVCLKIGYRKILWLDIVFHINFPMWSKAVFRNTEIMSSYIFILFDYKSTCSLGYSHYQNLSHTPRLAILQANMAEAP